MAGPAPKPTVLKLVQGNPGKRPVNQNEPQPDKTPPPCPKYFTAKGKYWFKRLANDFSDMGVLTHVDGKALELLVDTYLEWLEHGDTLAREGYTYITTSMSGEQVVKAHPAAVMKSDAAKRLRAMLAEFGATPASRSKVEVEKGKSEDPLEAFVNRKK